jgi:ribosomal protein L44E
MYAAASQHARFALAGIDAAMILAFIRNFSMAKAKKKPKKTVLKNRCGVCGKTRNLTKGRMLPQLDLR